MWVETLLIKSVCVSLLDVAFSALDGPVSSALTKCEAVVDGAWADLDESSCRMHIKCSTLRTRTHN